MHPPSNEGCICNPYILYLFCDRLPGEESSTTVLPDQPQGVADAAELLLAGLHSVCEGGRGILRGSEPVAGSELVNKLSLGIRVGGISPERWLLSGGHRGFQKESDKGG